MTPATFQKLNSHVYWLLPRRTAEITEHFHPCWPVLVHPDTAEAPRRCAALETDSPPTLHKTTHGFHPTSLLLS